VTDAVGSGDVFVSDEVSVDDSGCADVTAVVESDSLCGGTLTVSLEAV